MNRRQFLALAGATIAGGSLSACTQRSGGSLDAKQINIYSWADYIHPDTIPAFQKRYGIRVVYDTFSSNEALLAKLQAGANNYDIVVPTSYMVKQLRKMKLLSEIEHDRLPALTNIMPRFRNPAFDPHLEHSVPYTWGTTGIGFNAKLFPDAAGYPADWDVFWDKRFSQRITLLDDSRETIGMALKRRGDSYNCRDEQKISAAVADLKEQKPLTMCYTSDQVIVQLASGDSELSLVYSGDAFQAQKENPQVRYVIPKSGASLWLDSMCIPLGAPHVENAYKWLNFMLEPQVAAQTASYTRYATPNSLAFKLIDPKMTSDPNLYPPDSVMDKCEELGDVGQTIFFFDKMWTELKCT